MWVEWINKDEKHYTGKISKRSGNNITVVHKAKMIHYTTRKRIHVNKVTGYWPVDVETNLENLIKIKREVENGRKERNK